MKHDRLAKSLAGITGAMAFGSGVTAQEATSRADYYALGDQFAQCSAHWSFASEVARRNGLEDAALAFEGMERGWSLAGMIFLVDGLHPSRQSEVETLFENLQQVKVESLRAEREVARVGGDSDFDSRAGDRFQHECGPWIELQQAVIRELRSGPTE